MRVCARAILAVILLLPLGARAEDAPRLTIELLPDAWPALPRLTGYEFNLNNHHDAPAFSGGPEARPLDASAQKRKRYRVLGVVVKNEGTTPFDGKVVSKNHPTEARRVKIAPGGEAVLHLPLLDDGRPYKIEVRGSTEVPIMTLERTLTPAIHSTENGWGATFIAQELDNEQRVRDAYRCHLVSVRVVESQGKPLSHAHLTFLHDQMGLVVVGTTDAAGRWSGHLLAGSWTALAFGVATEEATDPTATATTERPSATKRTIYFVKKFDSALGASVELKGDQKALVHVRDESGLPLELSRLTVAPHQIADALRFADVARRCADAFILDLPLAAADGTFELLTNKGASYDLTATVRPQPGATALLTLAGTPGEGEVALVFSPAKLARLIFDPPTGAGGGRAIEATVTLLGAQRQTLTLHATDLETIYFPPGPGVRFEMTYTTRNGDALTFLPRKIEGKAGGFTDATPRAPFAMNVFTKKDRGIQCWVALSDATGQVVESLQSVGAITAWNGGEKLFEQALGTMRFGFPAGFDQVSFQDLALEAHVRIGTESLSGRPPVEAVRLFSGHGTQASAPRVLEDHVEPFLAMVQRSCEGEKKFLGGPAATVAMDFQVFLPPGVGGLGGGGMIALDLGELMHFADETDPLPWAFCHELGHNVGFGHDPYMLMAPCGVEEGTYGALGYRMVNGRDTASILRFLEGRRCQDEGTWSLSGNVFSGIRLLLGPEIHRKMFEQQRSCEKALASAGLSNIERIATQYSLVANENLAWIFRAYGWPVFDARVQWGVQAALTGTQGPIVTPEAMQIAPFRQWWVQGPLNENDEGPWQTVQWPTEFTALDQDFVRKDHARVGSAATNRYRLFARIVCPRLTVANVVCASDVALTVRMNGQAIALLDASPPFAQPLHDPLTLDQKKSYPVLLLQGENVIEVDATQPPGTHGFVLGLSGQDGSPQAVRVKPEGPEGEKGAPAKTFPLADPVANPGFEESAIAPWIDGPIEGPMKASVVAGGSAPGKRCLSLEITGAASGGEIQRVVVEPGATYRIRARVKADKLDGEARVVVFTGNMEAPLAQTETLTTASARWVVLEGRFASEKRRCVYVGCSVKATGGTVFFDDVELLREK